MSVRRTTSRQALARWMEDSGCLMTSGCLSLVLSLLATLVLFFAVIGFGAQWVMMQTTSTYVKGSCTIRAKVYDQVPVMDPDSPGAVSTAEFLEYTVWANGRAYDGVRYRVPDEAKEVVDRYEIGKTYPCWYNPTHPEEAVLFRDEQLSQLLLVLLFAFVLFLLLSVLLLKAMKRRY